MLFWIFSPLLLLAFLGARKAVTRSVGFDDVHTVGKLVEQCTNEALVAKDLGPVFEGETGGEDDTLPFIGAAQGFKEQFGAGLGKGDGSPRTAEGEEAIYALGQVIAPPLLRQPRRKSRPTMICRGSLDPVEYGQEGGSNDRRH